MVNRPWNILLIEDDEEDYLLTRALLSEAQGAKFLLEWASSYEDGKRAALSTAYDAILMDYLLGPKTGLDLTSEIAAAGCKAPIILLTGRGNYDIDIAAMEKGVTDYLAKGEANAPSLERAIRYAILQKQNEEALLSAKEELETRVQERTYELTEKNLAMQAEITERKRIEGELAELQRRLLDHVENERVQLARDLHDGPMQELYGLVFQVDTLFQEMDAVQGTEAVEAFKSKLLDVIQSLRIISRELRPPTLAPYGLEKAIRSHADQFQLMHPDINVELMLDKDGQSLPEPVRMALFRIYQTAISNILRHAQATEVKIHFVMDENMAHLQIEDNGRGFEVPKRWITLARLGHMGLVGAIERAEAAGGGLNIDSQPGQGTRIHVTVPRSFVPVG